MNEHLFAALTFEATDGLVGRSAGELDEHLALPSPAPSWSWGHIRLAVPIVHPLLVRARPSPIAVLLGLRAAEVEARARHSGLVEQLEALDLGGLAMTRVDGKPRTQRARLRRSALAGELIDANISAATLAIRVLPVPPPSLRDVGDDDRYGRVVSTNARLARDPTEAAHAALYDAVALALEHRTKRSRTVKRARRHASHPASDVGPPPIFSPHTGELGVELTREALVGLVLATSVRPDAAREVARFRDVAALQSAVEYGPIELVARVSLGTGVARVETTVGRALLFAALEAAISFDLVNRPIDAPAVAEIAAAMHDAFGSAAARAALRALARFGGRVAEGMALSLASDHFRPGSQASIVEGAWDAVHVISTEYEAGLITDGERYNRILDVWWQARQTTDEALQPPRGTLGALAATSLAAAAAVREVQRTLELAGKGTGEPREVPVLHGLGEGRTAHEVFALATGRPAVRSTNGESLRERLGAAYAAIRIVADDCGATDGLAVASIVHERRVLRPLSLRLEGRIAAEHIAAPDGSAVVAAGHLIDASSARKIDALRIRRAVVRSPVMCRAMGGVCARCYGWDPARRGLPAIGAAVGDRAAEAIAETALALSPPLFTISGAVYHWASRVVPTPRTGFVRYDNVELLPGERDLHGPVGPRVVNRDARLTLRDELGRELVRYELEPGDIVTVDDGNRIPCEGDVFLRVLGPHRPFDDLDGSWWGGRSDLTGLLDLREPDRPTVFAETDGHVRWVVRTAGERCSALVVVPDDGSRGSYHRVGGRYVTVADGRRVQRGDQLLLGNPRFDHALELGEHAGAEVLVALLAKAVARGGGRIADVHLELATRALLSRARVIEPGETGLARGMVVARDVERARSDAAVAEGGRRAHVQLLLTSLDDLARPPGLLGRTVDSLLQRRPHGGDGVEGSAR